MAFEVVWHPSAKIDLGEEIDYVIQNFGWTASKKLYDKVMDCVDDLSAFPNLGVVYEGVTYHGNEVRLLNIRQNTVVYSFGDNKITIIVFWNNFQNPDRLAQLIGSRKF